MARASTSDRVDPARGGRAGFTRAVTVLALGWGIGYLAWRVVTTREGAEVGAWLVLIVVELLAFLLFTARAWATWPNTAPPPAALGEPRDVGAVIDATGAPLDELRVTLAALAKVAGVLDVAVVHRDGSGWLRAAVERLGVEVHDPTVDLDRALRDATTDWVLHVRVGDLLAPDAIRGAIVSCTTETAVVQIGVGSLGPMTFDPEPSGHGALDRFEQRIERPALARRGSIPWYGDGPALIQKEALESIGGLSADPDPWWRTGVRLQAAGYRVTTTSGPGAETNEARALTANLQRRRAALRTRVRSFGSADRPTHLAAPAAAAHVVATLAPIAALMRLLQVVVAGLVLGLGHLPMTTSIPALAIMAGPAYGSRSAAMLMMGRGTLTPLSVTRSELRTLSTDLGVLFPRRARTPGHGLTLLVGVCAGLTAAMLIALVSLGRGWTTQLPVATAIVAFGLSAGLAAVAIDVLFDAAMVRQRRRQGRFRLGSATCRVEEHEGRLIDISTRGVRAILPGGPEDGPEPGTLTTLCFRVPATDGWKTVVTIVRVAHTSPDSEVGTIIGLEYDDPAAPSLDPVVDLLMGDRRFAGPSPRGDGHEPGSGSRDPQDRSDGPRFAHG